VPAAPPATATPARSFHTSAPPATHVAGQQPTGALLPQALLWVGVGGIAVATGSALLLNHKNNQAAAVCPEGTDCTSSEISSHRDLVSQARLARAGVYAGLGLGVAALSGAAALHFWGPKKATERSQIRSALRLRPQIGATAGVPWGAVAEGTW
jgi:hypothetical protein